MRDCFVEIPSSSGVGALMVILFVVVLLVASYIFFRQKTTPIETQQPTSAVTGGARSVTLVTRAAQQVDPELDAVYKRLQDSNTLVVLSGLTLSIQTWNGNAPYAVLPLTNTNELCTQFTVSSGPFANTTSNVSMNTGIGTQENSLQSQSYNNLNSVYLQSSPYGVNYAPLTDSSTSIQFSSCVDGATSFTNMNFSASTPACYAFPVLPTVNAIVTTQSKVTIPQDTFLLQLYYAPSSSSNLVNLQSATVSLNGWYNGQYFSQQTSTSLLEGAIPPYSQSAYVSVPTIIQYTPDNAQCVTIANVTSPKVLFNATFADGSSLTQMIDIVQNTFAIPPVGTFILDNSAAFFDYNNNAQNVAWLNDAVNFFTIPASTLARMPVTRIPTEGRVLPQTLPLFTSRVAFNAWKLKNKRVYNSQAEDDARYVIFKTNITRAAELNQTNSRTHFGATKFADLTPEEAKKNSGLYVKSSLPPAARSAQRPPPRVAGPTPLNWDWRDHHAVTPIKDQGQCSTCWVFAAVGAIEGRLALQTNQLVSLSEQDAINCPNGGGNCEGGDSQNLLAVMQSTKQMLMPESLYPYVFGNGPTSQNTCQYVPSKGVAGVQSYVALGNNISGIANNIVPEDQLATDVYQMGPLSICDFNATNDFYLYIGGIMTSAACTGAGQPHCMLLIGFGIECNTPYWIIKNSWGTDWGEQGYLRLQRNVPNTADYFATCYFNFDVTAVTQVSV